MKPKWRPWGIKIWPLALSPFAALIGLCLTFSSDRGYAQSVTPAQKELQQLRHQLQQANRDLLQRKKREADAAQRLQNTQSAVKKTIEKLEALARARSTAERTLRQLNVQQQALSKELLAHQDRLTRLLRVRYMYPGRADALQQWLAGDNPDQEQRDRYYSLILARAISEMVTTLQSKAQAQRTLAQHQREQNEQLAQIEREQQSERNTLLSQRQIQEAALQHAASRTQEQRIRIAELQRNESRLSTLIERLATTRSKKRASVRAQTQTHTGSKTTSPPPTVVERSADETARGIAFAQMRGKLLLPVAGKLTARFGAPREEGASWRGIFVETSTGTAVHAVADGEIAYAGNLRGYGKLLIVDHGATYLSVYGNNDKLLFSEGDRVQAGQQIAQVGSNGVLEHSGLYFELRHQGKPLDPLTWVRLR
jgi:septal ring factor EnvC (AmiA/AmiB activator)